MYHLAQINVGRLVAPEGSPEVADFIDALDEINALAEAAPGFVWRLKSESGNATDIKVCDDPLFIVNMSVWESLDALGEYVYRSGHIDFLRRRREWFEKPAQLHMALWWIPAGEPPTVAEGLRRIDVIRELGPSPRAFTFAKPFSAPDAVRTRFAGTGRAAP